MASVMALCCLTPIYSAVNSWSIFYFFKSFSPPWSKCLNSWNTPTCTGITYQHAKLLQNITTGNHSTTFTLPATTTLWLNKSSPYIEQSNASIGLAKENLGISILSNISINFNNSAFGVPNNQTFATSEFFE